jgi:hypothetical protein
LTRIRSSCSTGPLDRSRRTSIAHEPPPKHAAIVTGTAIVVWTKDI